jgi:hypothetical protein
MYESRPCAKPKWDGVDITVSIPSVFVTPCIDEAD